MFESNKKYIFYILDIIASIIGIIMIVFLFITIEKETPYLIPEPVPTIGYKYTKYQLIEEPQSIIFLSLTIISLVLLLISYIKKNKQLLLISSLVVLVSIISSFIISSYGINHSHLTKYSYILLVFGVVNFILTTISFIFKYILIRRLY